MSIDLVTLIHNRVASTSVGPSTARGMGPPGTIEAARLYLRRLQPVRFSVDTEHEFRAVLNRATRAYIKMLPPRARHWGSARKFLNIFLRGVLYNKYLCEAYELDHIEPWLEIPLDSHVAKGSRAEEGGAELLPRWPRVIHLDAHVNAKYQAFASTVAQRYGVSRIHLDALYWRRMPDE